MRLALERNFRIMREKSTSGFAEKIRIFKPSQSYSVRQSNSSQWFLLIRLRPRYNTVQYIQLFNAEAQKRQKRLKIFTSTQTQEVKFYHLLLLPAPTKNLVRYFCLIQGMTKKNPASLHWSLVLPLFMPPPPPPPPPTPCVDNKGPGSRNPETHLEW
jgi:hypothetical protein